MRRRRLPVALVAAGSLLLLVAPATPASAAGRFDDIAAAARAGGGTVRVLVGLRVPFRPEGALGAGGLAAQREDIIEARGAVLTALQSTEHRLAHDFDTIPFIAVEASPGAIEALAASPDVDSVSLDQQSRPDLVDSVPIVQGPEMSASGYDGTGWTVAVLDTGFTTSHTFLAGKSVGEACFSSGVEGSVLDGVGNCPNGQPTQFGTGAAAPLGGDSHGTHVAGIVAGKRTASDGLPTRGVAPGADLLLVQVFSQFTGSLASWSSDQIAGLEWVYAQRNAHNIAAVNMSLGGSPVITGCDLANVARKAVIDNLRSAGIATVIASGNNSSSTGISAPGCISTAVSAGATDKSDVVASYSNVTSAVSLLAPGSAIVSSVPSGGFASFSGTSMAAPHVAGGWAVLKQAFPTASVTTLLAAQQATGTTLSRGLVTGMKRVNLDATRQYLAAPTSVTTTAGDGAVTVSWSAPAANGSSPLISYTVKGYTGTEHVATATVGATSLSTTITGLTNGVALTFTVTATDAVGTGTTSASSPTVVPLAPLSAPASVTAVAADASATITWTVPAQTGTGGILTYTVNGFVGGATVLTATVASPALSTTLTGLTNGSAHTFTVRATTPYQTGPASSQSAAVTPRGAPGAPTGLTATAGDASVTLAWTLGPDGGSSLITHTVTGFVGLAPTITATLGGSATGVTFAGLTNGTAYAFTVQAHSALGAGTVSAATAPVTPAPPPPPPPPPTPDPAPVFVPTPPPAPAPVAAPVTTASSAPTTTTTTAPKPTTTTSAPTTATSLPPPPPTTPPTAPPPTAPRQPDPQQPVPDRAGTSPVTTIRAAPSPPKTTAPTSKPTVAAVLPRTVPPGQERLPAIPAATAKRPVVVNDTKVARNEPVTIGAAGFKPGAVVEIRYRGTLVGRAVADAKGRVVATAKLGASFPLGAGSLGITGPAPKGKRRSVATPVKLDRRT